jgi:hypothetical protein
MKRGAAVLHSMARRLITESPSHAMSATQPASLIRIYEAMTADAFPSAAEGVDAMRTTLYHAQEFLHTDRAHVLVAEKNGVTFFLAVPSLALAGHPGFATPLACALPGHPGHQGDGAYVLSLGTHDAAVLCRGDRFSLRCGYPEEVREAIRQEAEEVQEPPLQIIDAQESHARRMISEPWWYRGLSDRVARLSGLACLGVIGLCAGVMVAANVVANDSPEILARQANKVLASAPLTQPLAERLVRITELFSATTRAGGWIEGYVYVPERGEAFTATLPSWASADFVRELGEGVTTQIHAEDNGLLWARRADRQGVYLKGVGPAEIGTAQPLRAPPPAAQPASAAQKRRP